jgi:hypothetical protein
MRDKKGEPPDVARRLLSLPALAGGYRYRVDLSASAAVSAVVALLTACLVRSSSAFLSPLSPFGGRSTILQVPSPLEDWSMF